MALAGRKLLSRTVVDPGDDVSASESPVRQVGEGVFTSSQRGIWQVNPCLCLSLLGTCSEELTIDCHSRFPRWLLTHEIPSFLRENVALGESLALIYQARVTNHMIV